MKELKNLFLILDQEQKLFHEIKQKKSKEDKIKANMLFQYHMYSAIYKMSEVKPALDETRKALLFFIISTEQLTPAIAVINNSYQMSIMIDREQLTNILMGGKSTFFDATSDAAKLGALLALNFKFTGYTKSDLLSETLFSS